MKTLAIKTLAATMFAASAFTILADGLTDPQSATGIVRVDAGETKVIGSSPAYAYWYRFSVKDIYNCDGGFELSELAPYDASGNRVNLNLTSTKNSAAISSLQPGTMTAVENGGWGRGVGESEGAPKMFDGDTGTKCYMGGMSVSGGKLPQIVMRLRADAAPVASYGICTGDDCSKRTPVSWTLEDSEDGVTWRVIAEESDALTAGLVKNSNQYWANNGFPIGVSTGDRCLAPTAATIVVADGAKLVLPKELGSGVSHLVVDCAANGTIENFKAATGMTLNLTGFKAFKHGVSRGKTLPISFSGFVDLSSVATWKLTLDGEKNIGYECRIVDGKIEVFGGPGLTLIMR